MRPNESAQAQDPTRQCGEALTVGMAFYRRQIALLEAGDIEGLLGQYHTDARLVTFEAVIVGRTAIGAYLQQYLTHLGSLKLRSTDRFAEADDAIIFEATVMTDLGETRVYDAFVLREDKATDHFAGVLASTPPVLGHQPEVLSDSGGG